MKNVLVLIHDDSGQEARLQAALDLVRATEGHLIGLDAVAVPAIAGFPGEAGAMLVDAEEEAESANRARVEKRLRSEDVSWTLEEAKGSIEACLEGASGLADLIVLNTRLDGDGPDMRGIASTLVTRIRKPVLLVPEGDRGVDLAGTAVVAWDGSMPCMAALTAAVPLLALAGSVRLLEIQGSSKGSVREAAAYLSRHDIHAEVELVAVFRDSNQETGEVIEEMCRKAGAAYCVMGAYGHSPLREKLLGGVTRHMLGESRIPLLIAH